MNTLDWDKLRAFVSERQPTEVSAGILNDWNWTAATVYEGGEWKDEDRPYVTSSWGTPGFKAVLPNGDTVEVAAWCPETVAQAIVRKDRIEKAQIALSDALKAMSKEGAA